MKKKEGDKSREHPCVAEAKNRENPPCVFQPSTVCYHVVPGHSLFLLPAYEHPGSRHCQLLKRQWPKWPLPVQLHRGQPKRGQLSLCRLQTRDGSSEIQTGTAGGSGCPPGWRGDTRGSGWAWGPGSLHQGHGGEGAAATGKRQAGSAGERTPTNGGWTSEGGWEAEEQTLPAGTSSTAWQWHPSRNWWVPTVCYCFPMLLFFSTLVFTAKWVPAVTIGLVEVRSNNSKGWASRGMLSKFSFFMHKNELAEEEANLYKLTWQTYNKTINAAERYAWCINCGRTFHWTHFE